MAKSYRGIGEVYYNQGKYEGVLFQYGRTLDIQIRVLGNDRPNVAFRTIISVMFTKAIVHFRRASEIRMRVFGRDLNHPYVPDSFKLFRMTLFQQLQIVAVQILPLIIGIIAMAIAIAKVE